MTGSLSRLFFQEARVSPRLQILELLSLTVKSLVVAPEHASVEFENDRGKTVYRIEVHRDDRLQLLGKAGGNLAALRHLVDAIATKADLSVRLELAD